MPALARRVATAAVVLTAGLGVAAPAYAAGNTLPPINPQQGPAAQTAPGGATAARRREDASVLASTAARRADERQRGTTYSYTDLSEDVRTHQVAFATFYPAQGTVVVELRDGARGTAGYPRGAEQALAAQLSSYGASVSFDNGAAPGTPSRGLPPGLLIAVLIISAVLIVSALLQRFGVIKPGAGSGLFRQHSGPAAPGGGARAVRPGRHDRLRALPDVRFADVAGCDEAVEEVEEMKGFLVNPETFRAVGAKMPGGVLLYGEPGTGKTLLAKALAGEAGVPFFATSGSDFVEMYVGMGARRIRDLFAKARKCPDGAVIFIDEVDAVGARRAAAQQAGSREDDKTLNALLTEMDGFKGRDRIVVMAATNRLDTLDPALLRPGRFSRHIHVSAPTEEGRLAILRVHSRGRPLADDVDLERLAHITHGNSGADLAELLNEGAIWAARHGRIEITNADLWEGLCRVVAGPKKQSSMLADGEIEIVAYHEAGHVLAGELCPTQDKTEHATIEARGRALGFALKGATDRAMHNEQYLHECLIFILGGRAAEYVVYETVSSGAANDLQQANLLAREAVEKWGLSPRVGQLVSDHGLSEQMRAVVDEEVRRLVADAYRDAVAVVSEHEEQLRRIAQSLLASGNIARPEIELALGGAIAQPRKPKVSHSPEPAPVSGGAAVRGRVIDGSELFGGRRRGLPGRVAAAVRSTLLRSRRDAT